MVKSRLNNRLGEVPPPLFRNMENLSVLAISNEILKMTRDLLVAYAPLIGLLGGLKFVLDYLHKVIFGRKI